MINQQDIFWYTAYMRGSPTDLWARRYKSASSKPKFTKAQLGHVLDLGGSPALGQYKYHIKLRDGRLIYETGLALDEILDKLKIKLGVRASHIKRSMPVSWKETQ